MKFLNIEILGIVGILSFLGVSFKSTIPQFLNPSIWQHLLTSRNDLCIIARVFIRP